MSSIRDFGAKGDGKTDDTAALQHAVAAGDGVVELPRGDYRITRPVVVPLDKFGRLSISGSGGTATLIMAGAGPALQLVGTHKKTADPKDFAAAVWQRERFPTITDLEIVGAHDHADGIRMDGVMQPTLRGVLIRQCRHGIHLVNRNRNVLVADCHIYNNRGIGIFLDHVNLHQTNIHGCHISYNRQGGIVVRNGEVRNLQICANDIEYNYDLQANDSADVWLDARHGTIREGTIVGNTIQAKTSPGGTNVRLTGIGAANPNAVGMFTISGNLIGSQETNLQLQACRGVTVSGNAIYHGEKFAVVAEDCEHLVFSGNSHDHNPDYKGKSTDAFSFVNCRHVQLSGLLVQHTHAEADPVEASVTLSKCSHISVSGCQFLQVRRRGIRILDCQVVRVAECTVRGGAEFLEAIQVNDATQTVMIVNNFLGVGSSGLLKFPQRRDVRAEGNLALA